MNFVLLSRVLESFLLKVKRTFHHEINLCITSFNIEDYDKIYTYIILSRKQLENNFGMNLFYLKILCQI